MRKNVPLSKLRKGSRNRPGVLTEEEAREKVSEYWQQKYQRQKSQPYLQDFYKFCKEVLGYDVEDFPHRVLCDFISPVPGRAPISRPGLLDIVRWKGSRRKLILMPRGSFKTTVATISWPLFLLAANPDVRILIDSEELGKSIKWLTELKSHIEKTQTQSKYAELFPHIKRREPGWREEQITVPRLHDRAAPSISTSGLDTPRVGMHYDIIIADDLHSDKNTGSKEQIDKVIAHYKLLYSLLEPTGTLLVIGTRWHDRDLYGYILEREAKAFDIIVAKAEHEGKLLFPQRLTRAFLTEVKTIQGPYLYGAQYLNQTIDDESAVFKKSWLKYYDVPPHPLNRFVALDPALSEKGGDYSAIVTAGVSPDNSIYVLEVVRLKVGALDKLVPAVLDVCKRWKPMRLGIETGAYQKALKQAVEIEQKKQGLFGFRIVELKHGGRAKDDRIRGLVPRFAAGTVHISREMMDLEDELLRFPRGRTDDCIDALAYLLQMISPAVMPEPETKEQQWGMTDPFKEDEQPFSIGAHTGYWPERKEDFWHA